MRFCVLGPLEAYENERAVPVGGGRQRALLAILLVHAGETVSRDRLIEELWHGEPPASASQSLDSYLSRLRKVFRDVGAGDVLATKHPGYVLHAPDIDALQFEALVREGREVLRTGDPATAATRLSEALSLWRGQPYAEVADEDWARAEVGRLAELRLAAAEDRIGAELALGRDAAVIPDLENLATTYPTRERLVGQLIVALYRSGRQADALAAYRAARTSLVEELGIEPGPELRRLHDAVLAQDASLDLTPPSSTQTPVAVASGGRRRRLRLAIVGAAAIVSAVSIAIVILTGEQHSPQGSVPADGAGGVDPLTGRVAVSVQVGSAPAGITSEGGRVWVSNGADGTVTRIDTRAGHVDQTLAVGSSPAGIAAGAGSIWVANSLDGSVSRIDPRSGQVVQTIPAGRRPVSVTIGAGAVWVADADGAAVIPLDPRTGATRESIPLQASPRGIAVGFGSIWITEPLAHKLVRIDPRDGSTLTEVAVGGGAGPLAVGKDAVWVLNTLDGTLSRVDPITNAVTSTVPIGQAPEGVAAGPRSVWVADAGSGQLISVDPQTGAVRHRFTVGAAPLGVTLVGGIPWVAAGKPAGLEHRGGTLRVAYSSFRTLDPADASDIHPAIWAATGDSLVALTDDSGVAQLVPDLAAALPQPTDGGRTYAFVLRPGLRYSTGVPVRASDLRRELERLFVLGSDAAPLFSALRGAHACARSPSSCNLSAGVLTDDRAGSVILRLTQPDPDLLFKLALAPARPVPPGTPRTTLSSTPVPSTGPYRVESLVPGRRLLLVRNGRFHAWSRAAQPDGYPDRIDIQMQPDAGARIRAVLDGQADIALEVAAVPLGAVRTQHASQLHRRAQPHTSFLTFNVHRPPFDDVRARQAVNLALDRAAIARRFGGPFISTPTCQILPPRFPGRHDYCPWTAGRRDGRWHGRDLARARALVHASSTEGLPVTFLTNADDTAGRAGAGPLASALRSIGYRPRIDVARSGPAFGEQISNLKSGWNISSGDWTADYPSPGEFFGAFLACSSYRPDDPAQTTNSGGFCDPKLDRLLARAQTLQTTDPVAADALWAQADRLAVDQAAWAPMVNNAAVEILSTRVGDFTLDPNSLPQIDQLWVR